MVKERVSARVVALSARTVPGGIRD